MGKFNQILLAGLSSALLLAAAASGANAENRHGALPSRQMYMHHSHRPMMHDHSMMHRHMMRHRHRMMHRHTM